MSTQSLTLTPRSRRRLAPLAAIAIACVALLVGCMNPTEQWAHDLMNADRGVNHLGPLDSQPQLVDKAQGWAQYMASHSGGLCTSSTLFHSNLTAGAPAGWQKLGENVACRVVQGTTADAVEAIEGQFMASAGHRANILDTAYTHSGTGLASAPSPMGGSWIVVFEVQEFARL